MDKLLEKVISVLQEQGGNASLFLVAACVLALLAWHQYLRLARHKEDVERERRIAQSAREDLARIEARGTQQPQPDRRSGARRSTSRVLVVEDNDEMQVIIRAMLKQCLSDPEVKVSASTSEAVEAIDRFRPELLILDMNLDGQSGLEVLKYLHDIQRELPVLVYSGYEEHVTRVVELRRQTGLTNLTVLQKGADLEPFILLVPHLFKRRSTDKPPTPTPAAEGGAMRRERRVGATPERRSPLAAAVRPRAERRPRVGTAMPRNPSVK